MCTDCYNNCGGKVTSDKCVKYTGPDIEFLGIEQGDSLSMLEAALIEKLETAIDGTGITFEDLTLCTSITEALDGEDETLANVIQALLDVVCELKTDVTELQEDIDPPLSISAPCLTLDPSPTRDQILQAIATKLCTLNTTVTTISGNYVTTDTICALVQECIGEDETASQEYSRMPKYVALPYHGPLSVFNAQGIGLSSAGYDKVYICNGQVVGTFVTPDYRGRSPLGANQGMPGGTLDTAVDPSLAANAGYNISQGTKKGSYTDTLTVAQSPAHTHTDDAYTIPLYLPGQRGGDNNDNNNMTAFAGGDKAPSETAFNFTLGTNINVPAITTNSTGGGTAHNSTQPILGTVFIMYIP